MKHALILSALLMLGLPTLAAEPDDDITYRVETQASASDGQTPFWLHANRYGLSSLSKSNGYLRGALTGHKTMPAADLVLSYGADLAVGYDHASTAVVQQLYADLKYKSVQLSVGAKERPLNLKNQELSSGSQTFGINARPFAGVYVEAPEYFNLLKDNGLLGFKFHFGYGTTTDANWQKDFVKPGARYSSNFRVHTKSAFLRVGDEKKHPLQFEGGIEWATQFGGDIYNLNYMGQKTVSMPTGLKQYVNAIWGGGSDPTDGVYDNAEGNSLGSFLMSLRYNFGNGLKARAYYDHFFEDHSQIFWEYGWKDGLYGLELTLPENPVAGTVVYEYITTKDQSGPIYHDATTAIPDQISAADNYYNNRIYPGWQHWGQAVGNPFFYSPIYNTSKTLPFLSNRFTGHHLGLAGNPCDALCYRILCSYTTHYGTYDVPLDDKAYTTSVLAELTYSPQRIGSLRCTGSSLRLGIGYDHSTLIGNHFGAQLTLITSGLLKP